MNKKRFKYFIRCLLIILAIVLLLWLYNRYCIKKHLEEEIAAQQFKQLKWQKDNIVAWSSGTIRNTDTVIVILPEYYEDFYNNERIAQYNVDSRANFILTSFKRGFKDPFEVAKDISILIKELRKTYSNIIIVGHSKGTTINIALLEYLSDSDYDKMINISATYKGTILAMPEKLREICSKKEYGALFYNYYISIFDGDVADKMIRTDSLFLQKLNYDKINKNKFINIVAEAGIVSGFKDFWNWDFEGIGLLYIDNFLNLNGDGLVSLETQKLNNVKTIKIKASHKSSYEIGVKKVLDLELL